MAFGGVALLTLWALFVAVTRIFDLVIAGVYPEAWALTAVMTAPFTTGEMSRRIERDDRVHIEYVPTQVVTEFIRAKVIWGESKVDGIRYASSVKKGHASYVFFADQSNVVGTPASGVADDGWLRLADMRRRWFEPP